MTTEEFIKVHRDDDTNRLLLNAKRYVGVDVPFAVMQIEGCRRMASKLPEWCRLGVEFPQQLAMEQCSSELTARYKQRLVKGKSLADLTGGFGVDCYYMGRELDRVFYVEKNEKLYSTVKGNYNRLNYFPTMLQMDAREALQQNIDFVSTIFIDPARRDDVGRKMVGIANCEPSVLELLPILQKKCERLVVKLSPMIDVNVVLEQLQNVAEVHIVSVNNECKELLAVCDWNGENKDVHMVVVDFSHGEETRLSYLKSEEDEAPLSLAIGVGKYLYEPNAAMLKSGAFNLLCSRYDVKQLHANTHLYTSDESRADFPGRKFVVEAVMGFSKKELRKLQGDVECANITVRNFPESVDKLRKRLHLREGGDTYIFACTLCNNEKKLVKCTKYVS